VNSGLGKKTSRLLSLLARRLVFSAFSVSLLGSLVVAGLVHAKERSPRGELLVIAQAELPPQGRETYERIHKGGPFPYEKDGVVFGNRERILPNEKRGYYREYTVKTPESRDRGAQRIVCGGKPIALDACYYTADHYSSFRRIKP
jgi:ribonuclease T1